MENKKSEYSNLKNNYLCVDPTIIHYGYSYFTENELKRLFHELKDFECPDMYANLDDYVVLLEHFEFDATKEKKGMEGIKSENNLKREIERCTKYNVLHVANVGCNITKEDFQRNFEKHFISHYEKINSYHEKLRIDIVQKDKEIRNGFFIENQILPIIEIDKNFYGELPYFMTKQFWDFFDDYKQIGFIIFGCLYNGKKRLFYVDHKSKIDEYIVDLKNSDVKISILNRNEVAVYGVFKNE